MPDERRHHLRLLGALDALLSERNVTRAAARLHLSQSATSGTLAQLRVLFDDPLLVRVGRDLELTARAREMLPLVRDALAGVDRLFGAQKAFQPGTLKRQFRIAVSDVVGQLLVPEVVQRLALLAPGVTLKVSAAAFEVPERMLAHGTLDLVIGHYEDLPSDLRAMTLYESRLVAVARAAHPTLKAGMTLPQFVQVPQVVVFPHSADVEEGLRRVFTASARPFKLAASVQQLSLALAIVERTDALALVTEPMARLYAKTYAIQILQLPKGVRLPKVRVLAVWHERTQSDAACAWLREMLRDCAVMSRGVV
ncbi:MAG: LysR family transcriptional regulator [Burkholderiales bacterium]